MLTTCLLKQVKQSIKFNGLITRWHLFSAYSNEINKKSMVYSANKLLEYNSSKNINVKGQDENISKYSSESYNIPLQESKWPWVLHPLDRYKDINIFQSYITDCGEIMPRKVTKLNKKTHRKLCKEIKRYRNLGLILKTKSILEVERDSDI
ncbi:30S ribosomal protein S18 [Candidatus Hodgkinia cicadicola]|nr:30S ribosomal protein S18 [Candidatus Hodgkinia cicadicola]